MKRHLIIILFFFVTTFNTKAQNFYPDRLKVYIDCYSRCDMTFIRTEINIVDFLLDQHAADIHVLITDQNTGGGGDEYQLIFFGRNQFKNVKDTIRFINEANNTEFEERALLVKYLKLGLAPYVAKTKMAKAVQIEMKSDKTIAKTEGYKEIKTKDPWNYWVFRTNVSGNFNGESVYKSTRINSSASAERTTEELKTGFEVWGSRNISRYEFENDSGMIEKVTVKNSNYGVEHSNVFSLSNKWSYGYELGFNNSSFSNNKGKGFIKTAVEYNFYPYTEVNSRYLALSYGFSAQRNTYYDSTIYDKLSETLFSHFTDLQISFTKKWGNLYGGIEYRNFLHNWKLKNLELNLGTNVRITGGLSFNLYANYNLVRDQIYLPKGGATEQEILTRRRQLQTGFEYYFGFGLNFRFGSKLNNFINPRFNGPN